MESGFWKNLKAPIKVLAPMANVTDAAFRKIIAKYGKPDVTWTEFVSVEGLLSKGREKLLPDLWFDESERPIVAQVFGGKPEQFREVAGFMKELGFDGLDINMGCPDSGVERSGAGASLMKDPDRAVEIIKAATEGGQGIPVSVKTRIGYNKVEIEDWIPRLLEAAPAALTVHLRTRKEMSDVSAHWELASRITEIKNKYSPETILLGNGDIDSLALGENKVKESGMDGFMTGRGIFGNPWFFSGHEPTVHEKLQALIEHTFLFEEIYKSDLPYGKGALRNFDIMKKHYKAYSSGFDGAKELRIKLMEAPNATEVQRLVAEFLKEYS